MALAAGGCAAALDQNRARPQPAAAAATAAATDPGPSGEPIPGLAPPPKPFVDTARFTSSPLSGKPSVALLEHASPEPPVPLSEYGRQPVWSVEDFPLGPGLTGAAVRQRFGPPAGVAGVDDPWAVYRLTDDRELWLHFSGGDGPLTAADLVHGAENGYVRDRLYPAR